MAKYEIMLIIRGDVDENIANKTCDELNTSLQTNKIDVKKHGLKELAYEIKKIKQGYYYQMNFEIDNGECLKEFERLARINKNVLRQLVINLEKDYGYKAINNQKKVERNKKRAEIFQRVQEENKRRAEERLLAQQQAAAIANKE